MSTPPAVDHSPGGPGHEPSIETVAIARPARRLPEWCPCDSDREHLRSGRPADGVKQIGQGLWPDRSPVAPPEEHTPKIGGIVLNRGRESLVFPSRCC